MPALKFLPFGGIIPRTAPRLLPDQAAQIATNMFLTTGEIQPIRAPKLVFDPPNAGPWLSVFRAEFGGVEKWVAFDRDIDIARSAFDAETEPRFYITGYAEARYTPFSTLPDNDPVSAGTWFSLGVPVPQSAPAVSHSGGTGAATSRTYCYTYFSALGEESAPSPESALATGKVDGTWAITGMNEIPTSGNACTTSFAAGVTTVTNNATARHWLRVGEEVELSGSRGIVSEIVSPSVFKLVGNFTGASWSRVAAWNMVGAKRRLYRSAGTNASYQLVADDVGTTYNDTIPDADILGDELISSGWLPPPVGLTGIMTLPNGCSFGFVGRKAYLSEPFQPHAYPLANSYGTDYDIVGAGAFGSSIVLATAATPYILDGNDPAAMSPQKIDSVWPCLSKRGVVSLGDGVLYPTRYGMAYVGLGAPSIWTSAFYTVEEWAPLRPSTMFCAVSEGRVFVAYERENSSPSVLVFHPGEGGGALTELTHPVTDLWTDPTTGVLYLIDSVGVQEWNGKSGEFLRNTWRSKEVLLPFPQNYGACKIDFIAQATAADQVAAVAAYQAALAANAALIAAGDIGGCYGEIDFLDMEIAGDDLQTAIPNGAQDELFFSLYSDGKERITKRVFTGKPFRLPSGYKSDNLYIQTSGNVRIQQVALAETIVGLKSA